MKIGLALGGGGVRGLTHISILEAFDELGIKPDVIAGTSMGAIVGAIYASGISGREIKRRVRRHIIVKGDTWRDVLQKRKYLLRWINALSAEFARGGLIKTDGFLEYLFTEIQKTTFEDLDIPLSVIAADYWSAEEVVFEKGELLPAIQATMAVPGIFAPVCISGRVLVDGGVVNLVPYDHLIGRADVIVAVNVSRVRNTQKTEIPNALESMLGTFDIMQQAALDQKIKYRKPDIYIQPEIRDIRMLDFNKAEDVFIQSAPAVVSFKKEITRILGTVHP